MPAASQPKTSNGMSWLLVQILYQMVIDAGGPVFKRLDLAKLLSFTVASMLRQDAVGRSAAEGQRDKLRQMQSLYKTAMDQQEYDFIGRDAMMDAIDQSVQVLYDLIHEHDLVNPSLMTTDQASPWSKITNRKGGETHA